MYNILFQCIIYQSYIHIISYIFVLFIFYYVIYQHIHNKLNHAVILNTHYIYTTKIKRKTEKKSRDTSKLQNFNKEAYLQLTRYIYSRKGQRLARTSLTRLLSKRPGFPRVHRHRQREKDGDIIEKCALLYVTRIGVA